MKNKIIFIPLFLCLNLILFTIVDQNYANTNNMSVVHGKSENHIIENYKLKIDEILTEESKIIGESERKEESEGIGEGISIIVEDELEPTENKIDAHSVEVSTYNELVDALGDPDFTDIYFTDNIVASTSRLAVIDSSKTEQRIYGHAYSGGEQFTFTQSESSDMNHTIRVLNGSNITKVTVSNMNIIGRNYYGIVQVDESKRGVITRYENISYYGPQPSHNRGGCVEFVNMEIKITLGYGNSSGEIAEAYDIRFEGTNNIDSNVSNNNDSLFWMTRINGNSGTFSVADGAKVNISGNSYLFYTDGAANTSPKLIFNENSNFYAECGKGFMMQFVNEAIIKPNASVTLIQNATSTGYGFKVRDYILVDEGATFEVLRPIGTLAAVQLYNTGAIDFNNPERVSIYASNSLLTGFNSNGSKINIKTSAINIWNTTPFGMSETEPSQIWNKLSDQTLTTTVNWNMNNMIDVTNNLDLDNDPVISDITTSTLALRNSQLLVLGRMKLEINTITEDDLTVNGDTENNAVLIGTYTNADNVSGNIQGIANSEGEYDLPLDLGQPLLYSRLSLMTYSNDLRMRQYTDVVDEVERLEFLLVPNDMAFGKIKVPLAPIYVKRLDSDWTMSIFDSRKNTNGFKVMANISQPLTAQVDNVSYTIPDSLVFINENDELEFLSEIPTLIYENNTGVSGVFMIRWDEMQGILVRVQPNDLQTDAEYSTSIVWTLVDAP